MRLAYSVAYLTPNRRLAMPINSKQPNDCGYVCLFKGKRCEVYAPTTLAARDIAAKHFKAKKAHEVTVVLAESATGETVTHVAS